MRKQFSATFKAQIVQELLKEEKAIAQLAAEYGVHPTQLGKWKALALHGLPSLFEERAEVGALEGGARGATHRALRRDRSAHHSGRLAEKSWPAACRSGLPYRCDAMA